MTKSWNNNLIKEIKERLLENEGTIIEILKEQEFKDIRILGGEIRCALPDGDNETSVRVKLVPSLYTNVFTRSEFEEQFEISDFISLISFVTNKSFPETVQYIAGKVGVTEEIACEIPYILKVLNKFSKTKTSVPIHYYNKQLIDNYPSYIVDEWIDEGIPPYIQSLYDVRIDEERKRWLLPSYDEKKNLISLQARTYLPNYKELQIPKYIYYKLNGDTVVNSNLYGINIAYKNIKEKREVIIFEGAKSVMKAYDYGYDNCVAIQGSIITPQQVDKILSLKASVVLALDQDQNFQSIQKELKKLSMYVDCYYIDSTKLPAKHSPVDLGKETFDKLYKERRRYG